MAEPNQLSRPDPALFRNYLRILADAHLGGGGGRIDPSDVVQQTLLDAHRGLAGFRGGTEAEMVAWLRRLLACNLMDAQRERRRAKRDTRREVSLERALAESSSRIASFLAADQTSPSRRAERNESERELADALARLPQANRLALTLRHFEGKSLAEIAELMGRTPAAVAGLIKRGLADLRRGWSVEG
ncbi:sigma-70 family RNA polymerase sigma factor [Aquisphaera insulae]|uniref:sigma-70 family RNA polymerase sigma factor n=1 Tax=Aquisphaera insulae TaxID=2712864 RepID=UPI0013EBEC4E|nr:sigma-70 family RNA polymerase sigma factor [Aquisphaera insulae]